MQKKPLLDRKKRIAIFAIITIIGISIAYYNGQTSSVYKHTKIWDFDSFEDNTTPQGFSGLSTDQNDSWVVKSESSAPSKPNVLEKKVFNDTEDYHAQLFPNLPTISSANMTMKFKIVSGEKAQSAGLLLRFIDTKHYFVIMADSMANRLSLCKQTPDFLICNYDKTVTITRGEWHTLKALLSTQGIAVYLDGKVVIRANDQNYQSGDVGLWTKQDTVAYFDDIKIEY